MKRRDFLASVAGLFAAPFIARRRASVAPAVKPYMVTMDWVRDSVKRQTLNEAVMAEDLMGECVSKMLAKVKSESFGHL